jgi:PAS domain S-box-containing protein
MAMSSTAGTGPSDPGFDIVETIANHTLDAFLVTKAEPIDAPDGPSIVYVNPAFTKMTGYKPDEVLGKTPRILQAPETDRDELDRIRAALINWEAVRATLLNQTKSGKRHWVEIDIVPISDRTGWYQYWLSVQRDVTERVANERRLHQQDKMRALGELAGGMAHEINNALQPILGSIGLIADRLAGIDDKLARHARTMEADALHARTIVTSLLSFARSETPETNDHPVIGLLSEAMAFIERFVPSSVTLRRFGFPPDRYVLDERTTFRVSKDGLIQVLQNLVGNAVDASERRGTIDVALAHTDDRIQITVSDDGPGMDEQTKAQLFDPFFSTKPVGEGTGMGLSVVHGLVTSWGGDVEVHSMVGVGTTIAITLPIKPPSDS